MRDFYPLTARQRAAAANKPTTWVAHSLQLHGALKRLFPMAVMAVVAGNNLGRNITGVHAYRFGRKIVVQTPGELGPVDATIVAHYGGELLRQLYPRGWAVAE